MVEFPAVEPGEPVKISATTFAIFERCPESGAARLRGEFGPDTRPAFSGGLAHRIFARHLQVGPIEPDELPQACREEIGSSILNIKLASLGLRPSGLRQVVEEVAHLYQRFQRLPTEGFAGAEVELRVEPAKDVLLVGSVDAVFEDGPGARLVDWKTGDVGDLGQLHFYALLWAMQRGRAPRRVEAVSVRTGERVGIDPGPGSLADTARRVADMVNALRHAWASGAELPRRGGPWCRHCPLLAGCPEGQATSTHPSMAN